VTSIGTDSSAMAGPFPIAGGSPPGPPPADLLKRARALGAKSAGAANFGVGAALAAASKPGALAITPDKKRKSGTKRTARKRVKR
jgi:hypothetical protein